MPNRKYAASDLYKYGFNGKESDNEVKGEGAQYDYGFRIYDPRLGKFLSVDPLTINYPWYTPYQFSGNNPITFIDLDGLEETKPAIQVHAVKAIAESTCNDCPARSVNIKMITDAQVASKTPFFRSQATGTMKKTDTSPMAERYNREAMEEYQFRKDIKGATMDPLAGRMAYDGLTFTKEVVQSPIRHGVGVYEGIKDGDGWQVAKNAGLLVLDVAPFAIKGSGKAISSLESSFSSGGTKLVSSEMLEAFKTSATYGHASATFISPTAEINSLLSQGLTRTQIAEKLGITDPLFLKGDLIRIDVAASSLKTLNLRNAVGTEIGANNMFKPGGATSGGVTEGVVNGIPKSAPGVSTSTILKK